MEHEHFIMLENYFHLKPMDYYLAQPLQCFYCPTIDKLAFRENYEEKSHS